MAKSTLRILRRDLVAASADRDPRPLLERILDTPHLAKAVPQLQAEVLHRVIETCGLEQCGNLLALATPQQLAAVLDLEFCSASFSV